MDKSGEPKSEDTTRTFEYLIENNELNRYLGKGRSVRIPSSVRSSEMGFSGTTPKSSTLRSQRALQA